MADSLPDTFRVASRFGRYTILERIGVGGMGEVWAAYDPHLDRKIALKLIHSQFEGTRQDRHRARLLREAQALAKLSHPHVVTVYDVDQIDNRLYIAMEFVEGETVAAWVERTSPSWQEILEVYVAAARGLAAAHAQGIVHRDIKPSNIVVGKDKRVCVLDFGVAKALQGHAMVVESTLELDEETPLHEIVLSARQSLTKPGPTIGTPGYMALEQVRTGHQVGPAADQFSLAVSLYESLYGFSPYSCVSLLTRLTAMEAGEVILPPSDKAVPSHVFDVVRRALQPTPDERYPSMEAFIKALEGSESLVAKRSSWLFAMGAVLVAGVGALWMAGSRTEPSPAPCQGAAEIWDSVWSDERRVAVAEAVLATVDGHDVLANVSIAADRFGEAWKASWTHVCEATAVQGVQSQILLEARMDCLTASRQKMDAVLDAFEDADARLLLEQSTALLESVDEPAWCETLKPLELLADERSACRNAAQYWAASWNRERAEDVLRAFKATGLTFAEDTAQRVDQVLEGLGTRWISARTRVCEATQIYADQSEALLDVRMGCLDEGRREVDALIHVFLDADADVVVRAVAAAYELQSPLRCEEAQPLAIDEKPPYPQKRREIDALERLVLDVDAQRKAGRYNKALSLGHNAVTRAESVEYAPVLAVALLSLGRTYSRLRENDLARETLQRTVEVATEAHDARTEVRAWSELIYNVGALQKRTEIADAWRLPTAAALVRARNTGPVDDLAIEIRLHEGTVDLVASRHVLAEEAFRDVIRLGEQDPEHVSKVSAAWSNLGITAMETNRLQLARKAMQKALTMEQARLGERHPRIAEFEVNFAMLLDTLGEGGLAERIAKNAVDTFGGAYGFNHLQTAKAQVVLAQVILHDKERWREAELLLNDALLMLIDVPEALARKSDALESLAMIEESRNHFRYSYDLYQKALTALQELEGIDLTRSKQAQILNSMCQVARKSTLSDVHPRCSKQDFHLSVLGRR